MKAESDRFKVDQLATEHPIDWIAEAIRRTGEAAPEKRGWGYIRRILGDWKKAGAMDDGHRPDASTESRKKAQQRLMEEKSRLMIEGKGKEARALTLKDFENDEQ